jgi:hypothetical protein
MDITYISDRLCLMALVRREESGRVNQAVYLSPKWGEPVMALPYLLLL